MSKIEKAVILLRDIETGTATAGVRTDARAAVMVTVVYLCFVLSIPSEHIDLLLWYAVFPIINSAFFGLSYGRIFLQSLIILPLLLLIGIFNPILDHKTVVRVWGVSVTHGWLTFIGLLIRGLLSMQVLLVLIKAYGYTGLVRSFRRLGVPRFITTQLLMVFRYIGVLIEEGLTMKRGMDSRSFGRRNLSIKMWGILIGQLFLRSIERAERVNRAMVSRGFTGSMPDYTFETYHWRGADTVYLALWLLLFAGLRFYNLSLLFAR